MTSEGDKNFQPFLNATTNQHTDSVQEPGVTMQSQTPLGKTLKQSKMQDAEVPPMQRMGQVSSGEESVEVIQQAKQGDEISKPQTDFSAMVSERDVRNALDDMLLDLLSCQQKLEEKGNELAMKDSEIQELSANLLNKDLLLAETVAKTEALNRAQQEDPAARTGDKAISKTGLRTLRLHQEVSRLTAELEEKQKEMSKKELSWQEKLRDTEEDCQLKLAKTNEQHQADIGKLEELAAQLVQERRRGEELEARVQQHTSNAASLEELRHMCNFFKKNSEQLSRQNKEILAVNRDLQSLGISQQNTLSPSGST